MSNQPGLRRDGLALSKDPDAGVRRVSAQVMCGGLRSDKMPLAGYFRNVGAALFALLLIADLYLPAPAVDQRAASAPPAIRIHSERKWPVPVVFDTTQVAVAAVPASWDRNPPAPPATQEMSTGVREAFALSPHLDPHRAASVEQRKPPRRYAARSVKRYTQPQIVLAARQGQFGWFGFRTW